GSVRGRCGEVVEEGVGGDRAGLFGASAVSGVVEGFGGGGVVAGVLEHGEGAELGVGDFGVEVRRGGEDVEAVAVVGVAGGGGEAGAEGFAWSERVAGAAALGDELPAVGDEDVGPVDLGFVVVAGGDALAGGAGCARARRRRRGG